MVIVEIIWIVLVITCIVGLALSIKGVRDLKEKLEESEREFSYV